MPKIRRKALTPVRGQRLSDAAAKQLAKYWFRANLMHEAVHKLRGDSDGLKNLEPGNFWEFETFLDYWLSALFVLVEGFNKLRIKDVRVQRLFKEHLRHLKKVRHDTYHFVVEESPSMFELIKQLNWAEELHDAIGDFIKEIIFRRIHVERIQELRKARKE